MQTGRIKAICKRRNRTILNLVNRTTVEQKSGFLVDTNLHTLVIKTEDLTDKIMEKYINDGAYFFNRKGYYLHSHKTDDGMIVLNIAMYFLYKSKAVQQAKMYEQVSIYDFEKKQEVVAYKEVFND